VLIPTSQAHVHVSLPAVQQDTTYLLNNAGNVYDLLKRHKSLSSRCLTGNHFGIASRSEVEA